MSELRNFHVDLINGERLDVWADELDGSVPGLIGFPDTEADAFVTFPIQVIKSITLLPPKR